MFILQFIITVLLIIIEPFLYLCSKFVSLAFNLNGNKFAALIRGRTYGFYFRSKKLRIEHNVLFVYPKNILLGNNVNIHNSVNILSHTSSNVRIGNNSHIAKDSIISGYSGVDIGSNVAISSGVRIYTVSNEFKDSKIPLTKQIKRLPVKIGNDVFIGANAVILPGVTIHDYSVIAAGSIVNKDVKEREIVGGQPIKHINFRKIEV